MQISHVTILLLLLSNFVKPIAGGYLELYGKYIRAMDLKQDLVVIRRLLLEHKDTKLEVNENIRRDADLILCLEKIVQHSEYSNFLSSGIEFLRLFRGRLSSDEEEKMNNEIDNYATKRNKIEVERDLEIQESLHLLGNELERLKDIVLELDNLEYIKSLEGIMASNVERLMDKYGILETLNEAFNALHELDNKYDFEIFPGLEEQIEEYADITHIIYLRMGLHMLVTKLEMQNEKLAELDVLLRDVKSLQELRNVITSDGPLLKDIRFLDGLEAFTVEYLNVLDASFSKATGIDIIKKLQREFKGITYERVIKEINEASLKLAGDLSLKESEINELQPMNDIV